jgi:ATP-dependent helicase/nuclease subunit A
MTKPLVASPNQHRASDPYQSVWVNANAGSGKTHVLVDRVVRLMLAGTEPSRILCLTFTKAAAAEMANRLFGKLSKWTMFDDDTLREHLAAIGHKKAAETDLVRARRLFTLALESPGGLKIETIHAFCQHLLQLFPVESGVVPGFTVMDDVLAAATLAEARQNVLLRAEDGSLYAKALEGIVSRVQADAFDKLVGTLLSKRLEIADVLSTQDNVEAGVAELKRHAGLALAATPQTVLSELLAIDQALYRAVETVLSGSSKQTDKDRLAQVRAVLAASDGESIQSALTSCFMTNEGQCRAASQMMTKALATANADLLDRFLTEQARVARHLEQLAVLDMLSATSYLLTLASGIVREYERLKRERGLYDFTDLVDRTRELLTRSGAASWVLYKLDGGIDHILVDEAQDTSRAQWDIIKAIASEPFSGSGARSDVTRTLFVVGDRKQSIFSFQGADPTAFDQSRDHFEALIRGAKQNFEPVPLFDSYRSVPAVLRAVDRVFRNEIARQGLEKDLSISIRHVAHRREAPGLVELWPLFEFEEQKQLGVLEPVDANPPNHPRQQLAEMIACKISSWIGKRPLGGHGRAVEPGDILILVQRRNLLFDALIGALHAKGVPVAGADRLKLGEHIAVQDLLSLARFAIMPEDDLSLAELLKSPLMPTSCNEDQLFAVAHGRGNRSLWQNLKDSGKHEAVAFLEDAIALSRSLTPFEFFSRILVSGNPSGRKRLYARLGPEAADAIDAFLARALDDELQHAPSLRGFVSRFEAEAIEIKRDMQQGTGEVRLMTVHGAKGLEANIVIIPDAADIPTFADDTTLLMLEVDKAAPPVPFWRCSSKIKPGIVERWKEETKARRLEEYRRNLYVALTRAADELYVGGVVTRGERKDECWYALVERAMRDELGVEPDGEGVFCYRDGDPVPLALQEPPPPPEPVGPEPRRASSIPYRERPWLRPTDPPRLMEPGRGRSPLDLGEILRFRRGVLIHKLLQLLPGHPPELRASAAENFLRRHAAAHEEVPLIRDEVLRVITDEAFAPFFSSDSLAEVPVITHFGDHPDSRRIDRIAIAPDAIYLVDFKTDRFPPADVDGVQSGYIAQLARYARALETIYQDRPIRTALVWTIEPRLMLIPPEMLC